MLLTFALAFALGLSVAAGGGLSHGASDCADSSVLIQLAGNLHYGCPAPKYRAGIIGIGLRGFGISYGILLGLSTLIIASAIFIIIIIIIGMVTFSIIHNKHPTI